jgi:hypothetical protein
MATLVQQWQPRVERFYKRGFWNYTPNVTAPNPWRLSMFNNTNARTWISGCQKHTAKDDGVWETLLFRNDTSHMLLRGPQVKVRHFDTCVRAWSTRGSVRSLRTKRKEAAGNEEARPRQECDLISNSDSAAAAGATAPAPASCNSEIRRSVSLWHTMR